MPSVLVGIEREVASILNTEYFAQESSAPLCESVPATTAPEYSSSQKDLAEPCPQAALGARVLLAATRAIEMVIHDTVPQETRISVGLRPSHPVQA